MKICEKKKKSKHTWLESSNDEAPDLFFPFPSDLRRNFLKKFGDWEGDGVVMLWELLDIWDDVDEPDISRTLAGASTLCKQ